MGGKGGGSTSLNRRGHAGVGGAPRPTTASLAPAVLLLLCSLLGVLVVFAVACGAQSGNP